MVPVVGMPTPAASADTAAMVGIPTPAASAGTEAMMGSSLVSDALGDNHAPSASESGYEHGPFRPDMQYDNVYVSHAYPPMQVHGQGMAHPPEQGMAHPPGQGMVYPPGQDMAYPYMSGAPYGAVPPYAQSYPGLAAPPPMPGAEDAWKTDLGMAMYRASQHDNPMNPKMLQDNAMLSLYEKIYDGNQSAMADNRETTINTQRLLNAHLKDKNKNEKVSRNGGIMSGMRGMLDHAYTGVKKIRNGAVRAFPYLGASAVGYLGKAALGLLGGGAVYDPISKRYYDVKWDTPHMLVPRPHPKLDGGDGGGDAHVEVMGALVNDPGHASVLVDNLISGILDPEQHVALVSTPADKVLYPVQRQVVAARLTRAIMWPSQYFGHSNAPDLSDSQRSMLTTAAQGRVLSRIMPHVDFMRVVDGGEFSLSAKQAVFWKKYVRLKTDNLEKMGTRLRGALLQAGAST